MAGDTPPAATSSSGGADGDVQYDFVSQDGTMKKKSLEKGDLELGHPALGSVCEAEVSGFFVSECEDKKTDVAGSYKVVIGSGATEVDIVLESCVCTMRKKEMAQFSLPKGGELEIKLVDFTHGPQLHELEDSELKTKVLEFKEKAKDLFLKGLYISAFRKYSIAFKCLCCMESYRDETSLIRDLLNNMAICQFKVQNYHHSRTLSEKVLEIDKDNEKALFRRGVSSFHLQDYEDANTALSLVMKLYPKNQEASKFLKGMKPLVVKQPLAVGAKKMFA